MKKKFFLLKKKKNQGQNFGSEEFFTNEERKFSVKSKDFSTILVVKRSDFVNLLKLNLKDYERFCFIKDRLKFDNNYESINQFC